MEEIFLLPLPGSPKSQDQLVIFPEATLLVSLNWAKASLKHTSGEINPGTG